MGKYEKLFLDVMNANKDNSLKFSDVCHLVERLGYTLDHQRGSHRKYTLGSLYLNLQPDENGKAKGYQVRQLRQEITEGKLKLEEE